MKVVDVLHAAWLPQYAIRNMAHFFSQVGSPPLLTLLGAGFLLATHVVAWTTFFVFAIFSVLLPLVYVIYLFYKGTIGDIHMNKQQDRILPLVATCVSNVLGVSVLYDLSGESVLFHYGLMQCVIAFLFLGITPFFKLSLHSASASVLFLLSVHLTGYVFAALWMFGMVGWSRVYLKRHTVAQVCWGGLLGWLVWVMIGI